MLINNILMNFFQVFFIIFIFSLLITGIFLGIRSIQISQKNLLYITIAFILVSIGFIGNIIFGLGLIFEEILVTVGFILFALFTYSTFHQDYKQKFILVLALIVIFGLIHFIFQVLFIYENTPSIHLISKLLDVGFTFLTFGYFGYSSYSAYLRIKEFDLKPWIKVRYKLLAYSAFLLSFQAVPEILLVPYGIEYGQTGEISAILAFGITAVLVLIFSICNVVAWFMPKALKKILSSKTSSSPEKDLKEEEIMDIIKNEINSN